MANILITGGSGRLGSALRKLMPGVAAPSHAELDVADFDSCRRASERFSWPTVIHCAVFVSAIEAERNREACWRTNVEGTRNMVRAFQPCRFVYISTEYVFDGEQGNYSETDIPRPLNFYGLTKLVGEQIVHEYPNTLVIRAAIRADPPWRFPDAFIDQWTSDVFMSEIAPDIVRAARSDLCGIIHMGGRRRTIYEMASSVSRVGMTTRDKFPGVAIPRDTSLDSSKWNALKHGLGRVLEQAV